MFSMCLHVWKKLIKMTTVIKNTKKKAVKRSLWKISKDFKRRKRQKAKKRPKKDIKISLKKKTEGLIGIFLREKKKKLAEHRRNHYLIR